MKAQVAALFAGLLFGLGLVVSQMINPNKIIGFLNVTGDWDPSLALVLVAAVTMSFLGLRLAARRTRPIVSDKFQIPSRRDLDGRLIIGAAIFGIGWGLAGYCPGPALAALTVGTWEPVVFLGAMFLGSLLCRFFESRFPQKAPKI